MKIDLTTSEIGLLTLALLQFRTLRNSAREDMLNYAKGYHPNSATHRKCLANAKASETMANDATALLDKISNRG